MRRRNQLNIHLNARLWEQAWFIRVQGNAWHKSRHIGIEVLGNTIKCGMYMTAEEIRQGDDYER
jgi:hypothetical protein